VIRRKSTGLEGESGMIRLLLLTSMVKRKKDRLKLRTNVSRALGGYLRKREKGCLVNKKKKRMDEEEKKRGGGGAGASP
jgi:hypothetical protein